MVFELIDGILNDGISVIVADIISLFKIYAIIWTVEISLITV